MTWDLMETSASMWIPRSRITRTGVIRSEPTWRGCGNKCKRRPVVNHVISVFSMLSWSTCDRIQLEATSIHSAIRLSSVHEDGVGKQNPQIWVSFAKWWGRRRQYSISNTYLYDHAVKFAWWQHHAMGTGRGFIRMEPSVSVLVYFDVSPCLKKLSPLFLANRLSI